ncbi:hypothetical protein Acr_09g0003340 [Actinidia rufa]|uniref:Uncharacterized protein n=1 Tax=Actinidia rufa TaxID=165716 RepID=A0A7J0F596_9ERIC|nr:hypothetical protein Acr_09g0003340 [Actinidia rufa]
MGTRRMPGSPRVQALMLHLKFGGIYLHRLAAIGWWGCSWVCPATISDLWWDGFSNSFKEVEKLVGNDLLCDNMVLMESEKRADLLKREYC